MHVTTICIAAKNCEQSQSNVLGACQDVTI